MSLEALVADMALVHLLALVEAENMSLQGVSSRVGFVTQVTLKLLHRKYSFQMCGKDFATLNLLTQTQPAQGWQKLSHTGDT